jgi:hypothetical protein
VHRLLPVAATAALSFAFLVSASSTASAQEAPSEHATYVEAGGPGVLYSFNYEYRPMPELGLRAGASVLYICIFSCTTFAIVPLSINGLVGEGRHHFEYGAGAALTTLQDRDAQFFFPEVGYRYENPSGGFLFRAMFTPLVRMRKPKDIVPWGGVSFGYGW